MIAASLRRLDGWLQRAEERPLPWLVGVALLLAIQISPHWYATPDGAAYLSIARRLAAGGPVTKLGDTQLGFPLGYPLLISPGFLIGERPFLLLSVLHWILGVVFMLGVYRWARRLLGAPALWVTAVVMTNVNLWIHQRRTLSEAAFLAVMIWAVAALNAVLDGGWQWGRVRLASAAEPLTSTRAGDTHNGRRGVLGAALAAGALLIMLSMIREVGLLFGAGFAVALLMRVARGATTRRAAAFPLAVTAIAILAAAALVRPERIAAAGPAFSGRLAGYADAASAVTGSLAERLHLRVTETGELLMPGMFKSYGSGWLDINTLVYLPLAVALAIGWWMLVRRGGEVFAYTAPLYLGLHLAWPYSAATRYVLPLLPLFVACLWYVFAPLRYWRRALFAAAMVAHLGVAAGYWLIVDAPRAAACDRQWPAVDALAARLGAASSVGIDAAIPKCIPLMLELTMDRPLQPAAGSATAGEALQWLIVPEHAGARPGFGLVASAGGYTLLRHQD